MSEVYTLGFLQSFYQAAKNIVEKAASAEYPLLSEPPAWVMPGNLYVTNEVELVRACEQVCAFLEPFLLERRCLGGHYFPLSADNDTECPGCLDEIRQVRAVEFAALPEEPGRPRVHATNAVRQQAYRLRKLNDRCN